MNTKANIAAPYVIGILISMGILVLILTTVPGNIMDIFDYLTGTGKNILLEHDEHSIDYVVALNDDGKHQDVIDVIESNLDSFPKEDQDDVRYELAYAYYMKGIESSSQVSLNSEPLNGIFGLVYFNDESINDFDKALTILDELPDNLPHVHYTRGALYYVLGIAYRNVNFVRDTFYSNDENKRSDEYKKSQSYLRKALSQYQYFTTHSENTPYSGYIPDAYFMLYEITYVLHKGYDQASLENDLLLYAKNIHKYENEFFSQFHYIDVSTGEISFGSFRDMFLFTSFGKTSIQVNEISSVLLYCEAVKNKELNLAQSLETRLPQGVHAVTLGKSCN